MNKKKYRLTQEGVDELKGEREAMVAQRPVIADRIKHARALGDLSENAEYSDAKDAQAFNEGRIAEIESLLKSVTVVTGRGAMEVGMGSTVTVRSGSGSKTYTIVSFNEVDPIAGKISNESPLGKAFLHKRKGDIVKVITPKTELEYEITDIK